MANNRVACVHITHENIRLLEGRVGGGVLLVTRTAIVENASRFFHGDRLAYMSEMVTAIANSMSVNSFTAKDVYIVYDNKLQVDFFLDEKPHYKRERSINFSFGKKNDTDDRSSVAAGKEDSGVVVHRHSWGRYITNVEQGELFTTSRVERDLVDFMVTEFREHGYIVKSIEAPETAIFYMRNMVPFTYDALNKLVVVADDDQMGYFYQLTKDVPVGQKQFHFDISPAFDFSSKVIDCIKDEIQKSSLYNPHIMLVGDAFADPDVYIAVCEGLKEEGLYCLDTYALWQDRGAPINSIRVITPGIDSVEVERDGRFGLCICLLLRAFEKKPENLIEGFHFVLFDKKTKKRFIEILMTVSVLFAVYGVCSVGLTLGENYFANKEYERMSSATESQLSLVESERDRVKEKVQNLNTIDHRYNEIFKFVYEQVNSGNEINIASVDTVDMLPGSSGTSSVYAEDGSTETVPVEDASVSETDKDGKEVSSIVNVTGENVTGSSYEMKVIDIRGYSRTTDGPVALYKALVSANIGDVKIIGVEQVPLPSTETLFAFEMTVGLPS